MAPTAQLATVAGPILPLSPELERELALLFEGTPDDDELAAAIVGFAFDRNLLIRSPLEGLAHFVTGRDGSARMVRIVGPAPPPKRPPPKPRKAAEWTPAIPVKRHRTS